MIRTLFRGLIALIAIAILIVAATFFADHPGRVDIVWRDWEVETSLGVLVAAALAAALALVLAVRLVLLVLGMPRNVMHRRQQRRQRAGVQALSHGMIALASGDTAAARRHARDAERLQADPPLTLLLSAEAARLDGDNAAAARFFTAMLERPESEFAGLRGLLDQALRAHDASTAVRLAERARLLRPRAPWLNEQLIELQAQQGQWQAAREASATAESRGGLPPARARHYRGVALYELSRTAADRGNRREAIALAAEAQSLTPDLAVPAAHHARLLLQDGRTGSAVRAIERAWTTAPAPELAQAYGAIYGGDTAVARVKHVERLAARNPDARESHLAAAEAALEARLWGEAGRHLDRALRAAPPPLPDGGAAPAGPTPRLCALRTRLQAAEWGDSAGAREHLDVSATAPDPAYVCARCFGESGEWHSLCPHCGGFDTLAWRTPGRQTPTAPLPRRREPPLLGSILPAPPPGGDAELR